MQEFWEHYLVSLQNGGLSTDNICRGGETMKYKVEDLGGEKVISRDSFGTRLIGFVDKYSLLYLKLLGLVFATTVITGFIGITINMLNSFSLV